MGGIYLEGRFNGGFFALRVWGAYLWRGLYMEGLIFGILRYLKKDLALVRPKKQTNAYKRLTTLYRPYKFSLELETWINTPNKISFKLIVK